MAYAVADNSPGLGYISWTGVHIVYMGTDYTITNGQSCYRYVFWKLASPTVLQTSDGYPVLSETDCIVFINNGGIAFSVLDADVIHGDVLVDGSIGARAIAAGAIKADHIAAGAIQADHIGVGSIDAGHMKINSIDAGSIQAGAVSADKIEANSITAGQISAGAIGATEIAAGAIVADKIGANAIIAGKVAAGAIGADQILAESILASKLSVIAADLVNNVTLNGKMNGWGAIAEDGTGTPVYSTYDATEKAIKITTSVAAAVRSIGFKVDHDRIYRISVRYKKSAAHGTTYIGLTASTAAIAGLDELSNSGSGAELITPITYTTRALGSPVANWYNVAALAGSTSYVEYTFFVVGARRSELEFPEGANVDCAKLADTTNYLALRFLNWSNTVSTSMYIRDISVTEVGAGIIVAENIKAGAIIAGKLGVEAVDAGNIKAGVITTTQLYTDVVTSLGKADSAFSGTSLYRDTAAPDGTLTIGTPTAANNNDGSRNVSVPYTFSAAGTLPSDFIVLLVNFSSTDPTLDVADLKLTLPLPAVSATARTYVLDGVPADKAVKAAVALARNTSGGVKFKTPVQAAVLAAGTVSITAGGTFSGTASGNVSGTVNNVAVSTLTAQASAGNTANTNTATFQLTTNPNGSFSLGAISSALNTDGSMDVTATWRYTESTVVSDFILLVLNKAATAPTALVGYQSVYLAKGTDATTYSYIFRGLPAGTYSCGIVAGRYSAAGEKYTAIYSTSMINTTQTASITAAIGGTALINSVAASTVTTGAANGTTAFNGTVNIRNDAAPTNNAAITSSPLSAANDGSVIGTVNYTYTQGTLQADSILVYFREGGETVATSDPCVMVNPVSGAMKFSLKPGTIYRFGVQAVRSSNGGYYASAIVQGTDQAAVIGTIDGTVKINNVDASTVQSGSANGQIAFSGTVNVRSNTAPTNNAAIGTCSLAAVADGSVIGTVAYTYAQGTVPADGILVYFREAGGTVLTSDPCVMVNPVSGTMKFSLKPGVIYSFGVQAIRSSDGGYQAFATISQSTDQAAVAGNITVAIAGTAQINSVAASTVTGGAANGATVNTWLDATAPVGSFTNHNTVALVQNADGSVNLDLSWTFAQSGKVADRLLVVIKKGATNPGAVTNTDITGGTADVYEYPIGSTGAKIVGLPIAVMVATVSTKLIYSVGIACAKPTIGGASAISTVSSPAVWQNKTVTAVTMGANADNFWDLTTGEFLSTIGTDKTFHLDPGTGDAELTNIPIRSYTGTGVQRRATQLDNDSLDFLDCPTASPDDDILRARIGRLGVGGSILMDGEFLASIEMGWGYKSTINPVASSYSSLIQLADGTFACAYSNYSFYAVIRTSSDLATWSAESNINAAASSDVSLLQLSNGTFACAYIKNSNSYLVIRTSSDLATWSAESNINAAASGDSSLIQLADGTFACAYRNASGYAVIRTSSDLATWSAESNINAAASTYPSLVQLSNGTFACAYRNVSNYAVLRTSADLATWADEITINAAASTYLSLIQLIDGTLACSYRNSSNYAVMKTSVDSITWSSEISINAGILSAYPSLVQLSDGSLACACTNSSSYLVLYTLQRYAQIGAGIIESGSNSNGSWIKYGDGTMECWSGLLSIPYQSTVSNAFGSSSGTTYYGNYIWTFPEPFIATPNAWVARTSKYVTRIDYNTAGPTSCIVQWLEAGSGTASANAAAIGRWKA